MPEKIPWAGAKRNYLVGSVCYTSIPPTYPCQIIVRFLRRLREVTQVKWKLLAIQLNSYGSATNTCWKLHQYDMVNGASVSSQLVVDG